MLAQLPPPYQLPPWQTWVIPIAGLLSAVIALLMVKAMFARRALQVSDVDPGASREGQGGYLDRRKSPRRGGRPVKVLITDAALKAAPELGVVQNRSLGGLCLAVVQPYEVGEILSVRADEAPKSIPWIKIEVKYCYLRDDSWLIGCKFLAIPPWNVMMLFD